MKRPRLLAGVATALVVLIVMLFIYPHQMIAPGALMPAHSELEQNCFACHAPLRGASSERCTTCHKPSEIGIRTANGEVIEKTTKMPAFHADLQEANCTACHTDHAKVLLTDSKLRKFDHLLLKPGIADQCIACHTKPDDGLHRPITAGCNQCHATTGWKPANFAHDRYFKLDRKHNVACVTCHTSNQFKSYTCYGCHEHQRDQLIAEHAEEGIRNITDCVQCHRSSAEDGGEHGGGEREGGETDDD
jgi:hypothetical protein